MGAPWRTGAHRAPSCSLDHFGPRRPHQPLYTPPVKKTYFGARVWAFLISPHEIRKPTPRRDPDTFLMFIFVVIIIIIIFINIIIIIIFIIIIIAFSYRYRTRGSV